MGIADFEGRSRELAAWAEREFRATVAGVYGSSELFALTAVWPADYPPDMRWNGGGQLIAPTICVRIADPATNQPLAMGDQGEMQFKGPNVVNTYLGNPELTPQMFTSDGWFRSGDLGRLVAPNVVQFVCRMGEALRLRGFLVDPAEIEARLISHPAVQRTKVVGIDGPHGGAMAVAFVEPRPNSHPDEDELRQWCAQTLAKFKVPARIHVIAEMPVTSGTNGTKIRTAVLRELAEKGGASI